MAAGINRRKGLGRNRSAGAGEAWDWRDGAGRLKDFAARSFLLKLEARGEIRLPPLRERLRRGDWKWLPKATAAVVEPPAFTASLESVRPLSIEVVESGGEAHPRWSAYLAQFHYLGLHLVGENLGYLVRGRDGRDLACLLFGAAAWQCAPRERFSHGAPRSGPGAWARLRTTRGSGLAVGARFASGEPGAGAVARRIDSDWKRSMGMG